MSRFLAGGLVVMFVAFSLRADPVVVLEPPVSNVEVIRPAACVGASECPPSVASQETVKFTVKSGGKCHYYASEEELTPQGTIMTILDYPLPKCKNPDVAYYKAHASVGNLPGPFRLVNPIFVQVK